MFNKVLALILVALFSSVAVAKDVHAEEKIALVSLQRALNEVNEGKAAKTKLKRDFESKKKQIDDLKVQFEGLNKDLERDRRLLSQDALKAKTQELQAKYMELQNKAATYERELKTQEAETAQRILTSLRQVVNNISAQSGYTLVIENSTETVLFSKNAEDITDKVIAAYNKR